MRDSGSADKASQASTSTENGGICWSVGAL